MEDVGDDEGDHDYEDCNLKVSFHCVSPCLAARVPKVEGYENSYMEDSSDDEGDHDYEDADQDVFAHCVSPILRVRSCNPRVSL